MKKLELNQMENLAGGSCVVSSGAYVGTIIIVALSGPIGWLAIASLAIASVGVVDGCMAN